MFGGSGRIFGGSGRIFGGSGRIFGGSGMILGGSSRVLRVVTTYAVADPTVCVTAVGEIQQLSIGQVIHHGQLTDCTSLFSLAINLRPDTWPAFTTSSV